MGRKDVNDLMAYAEDYLNNEHVGEKLAGLPNDYARYQYCWQRAVYYRNAWLDGQRNLVASTLASTHVRYEHASRRERIVQAKITWYSSVEARDLAEGEQDWHRWAQGYLAAWQTHTLQHLAQTLDQIVDVLRTNGG